MAGSHGHPRVFEMPYVGPWRRVRNDQERVVPVVLLIGLNALLQVVDAFSTAVGLWLGGQEANPLMAILMEMGGITAFLTAKVVVIAGLCLLAVMIARRREASPAMFRAVLALALAVAAVIVINAVQITAAVS